MTQLILNIEDKSVLPMLRKIVRCFKGVTIVPEKKSLEDFEPNEETRAAMRETESGVGLEPFDFDAFHSLAQAM